jgi:hypothetical protein
MRAPWYERERGSFDLNDPRALRPEIQMYDGTDFVARLTSNPAASLAFGLDDQWSYPVPVTPSLTAKGRERFATSKLVHTSLSKLYQPSHSRFYAVVVEVFCDLPGLPRAASHSDLEVGFVMRRQHTTVAGEPRTVRQLARNLMRELAAAQHGAIALGTPDLDVHDLWSANEAERIRIEQDNAALIDALEVETSEQGWLVGRAGGQWRTVDPASLAIRSEEIEQVFPMWRIPPRADDCEATKTRSMWFGLVPTYSGEHWTSDGTLQPKLDDHEIYQLRCVVTQPPERGHENCPPKQYVSEPTRPFRLAAAFDPDGTKNHTVSITAPDLRKLAARASQRQGPGGVRISSPPQSALSPIDFKKVPGTGLGSPGGGSVCTFAIELFFIVAMFLFLLFLPIVVFAFQLWWLLALRFCLPPSVSFNLLSQFFAGGHTLGQLAVDPAFTAERTALDEVIGVHDSAAELRVSSDFSAHPEVVADLLAAVRSIDAQLVPVPPEVLTTPPDPLCPTPQRSR